MVTDNDFPVRMAGRRFGYSLSDDYADPDIGQSFLDSPLLTEGGAEIAMTPQQARGLINKFVMEAERGNITPDAFTQGLFELGSYGVSPDLIRRNIRNTLASPVGRAAVNNPAIAERFARTALPSLKAVGVNPNTANKYIGIASSLLKQAKEDNLLRSNVTETEVRDKLQRPLYSAIQGWLRDHRKNPQYNKIVRTALPDIRGYLPNGSPATPLEALFRVYLPIR